MSLFVTFFRNANHPIGPAYDEVIWFVRQAKTLKFSLETFFHSKNLNFCVFLWFRIVTQVLTFNTKRASNLVYISKKFYIAFT